mmetsp:Transcript_25711/g.80512  ORF Transcript_25711/g.80512 Transcript_25711/m.80512 type:complete len:540 (-) Transcript_25711:30-1649(-)
MLPCMSMDGPKLQPPAAAAAADAGYGSVLGTVTDGGVALLRADGDGLLIRAEHAAGEKLTAAGVDAVLAAAAAEKTAGAPLVAFWPCAFEKRGELSVRALLQFADGTLAMQDGGRTAWKREEALASVVDAKFVAMQPPALLSDAQQTDGDPLAFDRRMRLQLEQLKGVALGLLDVKGTVASYLAYKASYKGGVSPSSSHNFGFAKIAVLLAAPGRGLQKVFGVDMRDGAVLWSGLLQGEGWRLFASRPEPHKRDGPEVLLLRAGDAGTALTLLDATTGAVAGEEALAARVEKALDLGVVDPASSRRVHALLSNTGGEGAAPEVALYPDSEAIRAAVAPRLHYHDLDREAGTLRSFMLPTNATAPPVELGAISWPSATERVAAVAYSDASAVKSATHELGDGSLLIKYLNPNLVVVATVDPSPASGGGGGPDKPSLFINVVDVVSSKVLYRAGHANAGAPLRLTLHENWVIYSYWTRGKRGQAPHTEIGAVSLFEGHIARKGLNPFNKPGRSGAFSSFANEPPAALQRSFRLTLTLTLKP